MGLGGVDWAGAGVDASGRLQPVWLKALLGRGPAGIRGTGEARSATSWPSGTGAALGL